MILIVTGWISYGLNLGVAGQVNPWLRIQAFKK
jgi:hypothetical protein